MGAWLSGTDGSPSGGHVQQAFWPFIPTPGKIWSVTHPWLVSQVLAKARLFSLNFAWNLPVRDSCGIWNTNTERPGGAIRSGLMEINPKTIVPRFSYFLSLFGSISWFLHFMSMLLLTGS